MLDTLKKAYRYYFYRMYLFYLKRWNNKIGMALMACQAIMMGTFMLNFATLFIIWENVFKINRINLLPDYQTYKTEIIIAIIIINTIFLTINKFVLINKFDEIVHEFKNEKEKTHTIRGWVIVTYVIGSFIALFGLMLATIDG